ncbi:TIGR01620 family protein [Rheinheimera maricola]|uniref:TIGR01620 family protein n=1 Tax=Rheinheimera maricola TaxID=2793282 RepID=A0ABS7X900_9GAMM|nr:TIGR01620 family protein [Rheinheimera maricola]MBZ9612025.1 TIGR01620 family protein [Rheinheimera maricola]
MSELKQARHFKQLAATATMMELNPDLKGASHHQADSFRPEPITETMNLKPPSRWWWTLASVTLLAVVLLSVWQWLLVLQQSWQQSVVQGAVLTLISAAVLLLLSTLVWREATLWRRLARNRKWQQSADRIRHSVQFGEAEALCQAIASSLPSSPEISRAVTLWRSAVKDEHSDEEQLQLFENFVLAQLDQQAQKLIYRAATDSSLAVAISPFALADMLLVLWRSSRLVRELAQLYGGAIGQLRSVVLLKQLFTALLWAGGSELALDMASDVMSSELTAKLSARAGQGIIAGLLVARLGNLAQQKLRPLPATASAKVSLKSLANALVARFKTAAQTKADTAI